MKKVTILLTFLFLTSFAFSQVLDESFEGLTTWPPSGWTIIPEFGDGAWMIDDGTYFGPGTAYDGTYAAMFDNYDYANGTTGSMITSSFDVSGLVLPTLTFYWWNDDVSTTPAELEVYSYNGVSYTLLDQIETYGSGASTWVKYTKVLGTDVTAIKFTGISDYGNLNTFVDKITIKESAPEIVSLGLEFSTDKISWTALGGSYPDGFTMDIDKLIADYYINLTASTTTNVPLAVGYYGFYLDTYPADFFAYWAAQGVVEGATGWQGIMWEIINGNQPIFYTRITNTDVQTAMLVDGLRYLLGQPDEYLNFTGYFPSGDYSFSGKVENLEGTESDLITIPITLNDVTDYPEFTVVELKKSTALPIWNTVDGDLASGFSMQLDPAIPFYFLDFTTETTTDLPLTEDYYPFLLKTENLPDGFYDYWFDKGVFEGCTGTWEPTMWQIISGEQPMFYIKVFTKKGEQAFMLVDGLQKLLGQPDDFLRVNGTYPLGKYSFEGTLTSDQGIQSPAFDVSITFLPIPFTLPFCENWDSMDFATNYWTLDPAEGSAWDLTDQDGNPQPTAFFYWNPQQLNYENTLSSYELDGTELTGKIYIQFDLLLSNYDSYTTEWLSANVYDGTTWHQVGYWDNQDGDIPWTKEVLDISAYALGNVFKVAFIAGGEDSYDINFWFVDNICVYQPVLVAGTVTELATGDPINGAEVTFDGYEPATTLPDGTYEKWLMEGTYDGTATAYGYNPLTLTDQEILSGQTNTVDFALTAPTLEVDPESISDVLWYGESATHYITIANNGDGPLSWDASLDFITKAAPMESPFYKKVDGIVDETNQIMPNASLSPKTEVLWDNTNINATTSGIVSSDLTGVMPDGRVITADDFIVAPYENWTISFVYTAGFSNTILIPDAFAVEFYNDLGGKPGTMIYREELIPDGGMNITTQLLSLSTPLQLGEGHYWLSVYAVYEDATSLTTARWNWYTGSVPVATQATLNDFGGFFGLPAGWFYLSQLGVPNPSCYFVVGGDKTSMFNLSETSGTVDPGDSQMITFTANANVIPGTYGATLSFYSDPDVGVETVDISLQVLGQQIMVPSANQWGYVSTYIDLNPLPKGANHASMEYLLSEIDQNMVILIGEEGIFWPSQNINTIGNWNNDLGYKIKMGVTDNLVFVGEPLTDQTVTFSAGIHIIPVLSTENVSVADVLVPHGSNIVFAFDMEQSLIYWPPYINTLTTLKPGFGYLVKFAATTTLDFGIIKGSSVVEQVSNKFENISPWNDVVETGDVHFIGVENEAASELIAGDIIGVFNNSGLCVGMTQVAGQNRFAFAVYGNDETTDVNEGMSPGEMMNIKIFRNGEVFETTPVYSNLMPNADGNFAINGLSVITSFKVGAVSVENDPVSAVKIYPNPSTGIFNINMSGISNPIEIKVTNSQGQLIYNAQLNGSQQLDLSGQPNGVYFLRLISKESVRLEKLVVK